MANTKIPAELSSTPGIIDNSNATAITIDSSENVGIGTSPENSAGTWRNLQFGGGNLAFRNGGANDAMIGTGYLFKTDNSEVYKNTEAVSRLFFDNSSMIFQQAGSGTAGTAISWSEAIRIDSSGNLLVGTTDVDLGYTDGDTGVVASANGMLQCARDSGFAPLYVQKLNNDGDFIEFNKDGTSVGSIGTSGGLLNIGSDDTGLLFVPASDAIVPSNPANTVNGGRDASVDLGNIYNRFKDLYLSGGVHLGGTGSANKLDDYEEGTFDPTLTPDSGSVTMYTSYNTLAYTKVGRVVTITGQLALTSVSSPSGEIVFGNLPFAMASLTNKAGQTRPSIHIYASGSNAPTQNHYFPAFIAFNEGGTTGLMIATFASSSDTSIANWLDAGSDIFVNFSYITD